MSKTDTKLSNCEVILDDISLEGSVEEDDCVKIEELIEPRDVESTDVEKTYTFSEAILITNERYLSLLNELIEKFKYHDELLGTLEYDLKSVKGKLEDNENQVIYAITDNFLFCLEAISDHNADYFIYQKEKIVKKNKTYKNKLPKLGSKTLLKRILKDCDSKYNSYLFKFITDIFMLFIVKNEDDTISFSDEYIDYVKENFDENKNFSKMIMVFDNVNNILNNAQQIDEPVLIEEEESWTEPVKNKKGKKKSKSSSKGFIAPEFMKNLENTKIAQLAKNISEKINMDDFPELGDPMKLLSSLGNPCEEGGIQNLLKFVIGEVETSFKSNGMDEKQLINEAQDMMGNFSNLSGIDPMKMFKDGNLDMNQFANIFSKMSK